MNNLYPWGNSRPFNAYSNYMKKRFGQRVQKLSVDLGLSCPNRDGTLGRGGCIFCNNEAFNPSYCRKYDSLDEQIAQGILFHRWRYEKVVNYLVYFQPYSNTYCSIETLKRNCSIALSHKNVIGLVIGTRPDCVDNEKLDYLQSLNEKYHIIIEYGIESCFDKTLNWVNRKHDFNCTQNAIIQSAQRGIEVGGHLIFGLPTEDWDDMLSEAEILSNLPINHLKFHQLQILKNTLLEQDYLKEPTKYKFFSFEQYKDFVIKFLERLKGDIIIERFCSEVPPRYNAGPNWGTIRNERIVQLIEEQMIQQNTYQGRLYKK